MNASETAVIRTFRISYEDRWGRRAEELVAAFDASSALRAFRHVRPDAADAKCEDEQGEPGVRVNPAITAAGENP